MDTDSSSAPQPRPQKVLIIGGGPCGLVTLRNFLQSNAQPSDDGGRDSEQQTLDVELVERRDEVGGVWFWSDETYQLERSLPPSSVQGKWPISGGPSSSSSTRPHWPSPAYRDLKGNVYPSFLEFSDAPFPPPANGEPFPTLAETHAYLLRFAEPLRSRIRLNTEVVKVEEQVAPGSGAGAGAVMGAGEGQYGGWEVTLREWDPALGVQMGRRVTKRYDAVIVAAGWYDTPLYPATEGIELAKEMGFVHHAKWYRDTSWYEGKRVVVVGNNNSSNEAAAHLAPFNTPSSPVYRSIRRPAIPKCPSLPDERIKDVASIARYIVRKEGSVVRKDGSELDGSGTGASASDAETKAKLDIELEDGTVICEVDYVLLGTGYGHSFPFVQVLASDTSSSSSTHEPLTPPSLCGSRIPRLYKHLLYARDPTLAFVGAIVSFFPFQLADLSSRWIAETWKGNINIPATISERLRDERERLEIVRQRQAAHIAEVEKRERDRAASARPARNPPHNLGFHVLGPDELSYGAALRARLVQLDASLDTRLPAWDEERDRRRLDMYARKLVWLREKKVEEEWKEVDGNEEKEVVEPIARFESHHLDREGDVRKVKGAAQGKSALLGAGPGHPVVTVGVAS